MLSAEELEIALREPAYRRAFAAATATLLALLEEAPAHTPQAPEKRALEILKRMQGR